MKAAAGVIAAALLFAIGCAQTDWIDRTLVTVDVTGVWQGTFTTTSGRAGGGGGDVVFALQQRGAKVTGQMKVTGGGGFAGRSSDGLSIEGTVNGDTFTFHEVTGLKTNGEFQVNGDEMTGSWTRLATQTATLRRQQ